MGHGAGAGGEGLWQRDEAELGGGKERDFLGKTAQVQSNKGESLKKFEDKVAVTGCVHGVGRGRGKAQLARGDGAVQCEGCAGNCAGAERAEVEARTAIGEARGIAQNHFNVGEQPVGHVDRLGALQVRVAGHEGVAGVFGELDQRLRPGGQRGDVVVDLRADVEAEVGGDLLVAAAAGVQLETERADALDQRELDEVVNVLG